MTVGVLTKRATYLKEELLKAQSNVQELTNQLQQASAHLHTVSGHFNEVAYLLGEAQKEAGDVPADTQITQPEQPDSCKEQEDGKVDCEGEESCS